ncbi:FAD-binding protein [Telmatocola sphagniphila]|uniref:FAD-binding protein n=1 Tax=Telmatocola sphagniphila TaxID=1123043 RepID=A0A8E6B7C7_9BACT|nr:FAD-linked oxidase C-terminal domain-containing protein [Telmatocola sphagniphila]QVL33465.1 FAD-binding protein [Telmatocola sphagniphila]
MSNNPPTRTGILVSRLQDIVGHEAVLTAKCDLAVYECDGYTIEKNQAEVVVFPSTTDQIVRIVKICNELQVPFLARGAGTSLAGGCVPVGGGVMIGLSRMKKILEVDYPNRFALVEPGVVNVWLSNQIKGNGFHYAPDPSSQGACTIGGNVATNSGGPHTLKYGVTVNHVIGVELVLPNGEIVTTGGAVEDMPGYDLSGVIVGSEGTFGVVSKAWVRLTRNPEAYRTLLGVFETVDAATNTISEIIGAGIIPAALELLDQLILGAVEQAFHFGFPLDAGAVLIMEVDGLNAGLDQEASKIEAIAHKNGAREVRRAATEAERLLLWKCRKQAFGAVGRLAPSYCTQDGVVPRTKLPEMLRFISGIATKYQLKIANVFHAGDGNLHPILLFDERDKDQLQRVLHASHEILDKCIELGGSVTGEHGIGVEKLDFMTKLFSADDLNMMIRLRDAFNPTNICSPNKMLPTAGACSESGMVSQTKPNRRAAL